MNAELLLEHYERIAEAPDAIARLRRFVLDLAVRGKLVEQDPNDEHASELLQRIKANAQHEQKRRGKTRNTSASNALEETPFEVPIGWTFASLGELVRVLNGRAYKQQELLDKGTPVLRVGNLFTSNHWYYSDLPLDDDKHCEAGDLIYAWSASFGPFIWNGPRVIYHYHIWKLPLVSEADLDKYYLYNFLLQKTREIKDAGHGISMVHMTKEKMEKLVVPLPPLAEQHRIVAKVDELMVLCDQLATAQAEREIGRDKLTLSTLTKLNEPDPETFAADARLALEHFGPLTKRADQIKQLRQTILNLAVRGMLVEQDPNDEPASELLRRITYEKNLRANSGKIRRSKAVSINGEPPFDLPNGWQWAACGELGLTQTGSTPPKNQPELYGTHIPFIHPGDIYSNHVDYSADGLSEIGVTHTGRVADAGSVLMVCIGTIGKCQTVNRPVSFNQQINALTPLAGLSPSFVFFAMRSEYFQRAAWNNSARTTIAILNKGNWETLPVPIPPLAEQDRIVAKVDELMALCDQLEASLAEGEQTRSKLLEAVLHEALEPA